MVIQQPQPLNPDRQFKTVVTVGAICELKLQQYVSDWHSRPADNNISFWRDFVAKYYAPDSKRRLCTSACKDQESMSLQNSKEKSQCALCNEDSEKSFEVSFEEMAETFQKKFKMVKKELLCLEQGKVSKLANGRIVIFYENMTLLSIRQSSCRSSTGQLVVAFNAELKILQWNCCLRRNEEFISRRVLGPQLCEILQNAKAMACMQDTKEARKITIRKLCGLANLMDMYRAGTVQPPVNSMLPGPPSNQNRMLVQGLQELPQQLQLSPNRQFKTVVTFGGICEQKLLQYMSEWNSGPADNNISFWRNFVAKYYAPGSKRRFCISACKDQASMPLQLSKEKWQCAICNEVSEKVLEVSFEEMAETFQKKSKIGMKELLCLDGGKVSNSASGEVMIFYKNVNLLYMGPSRSRSYAGQLAVTFNTELKILQWNYCLCHSEEFVSSGVLGPQLTEIFQDAVKYEKSQGGNESGGDPQLEEKIMKMICEFAESRTSQVRQCVGSMNSPQNKNNFTESRHRLNPTSDAMAVCGNPNSFKTLKRSLPNNGLEMDPHPGQRVTRQRLEVNTSNNDSNNTALFNLAEQELLVQEHHRLDKMMDKIFAAKSLKDLHALIDSITN